MSCSSWLAHHFVAIARTTRANGLPIGNCLRVQPSTTTSTATKFCAEDAVEINVVSLHAALRGQEAGDVTVVVTSAAIYGAA